MVARLRLMAVRQLAAGLRGAADVDEGVDSFRRWGRVRPQMYADTQHGSLRVDRVGCAGSLSAGWLPPVHSTGRA